MADDPGSASACSPRPSTKHTPHNATDQWTGEAEMEEFSRIFTATMSADEQERNGAEREFARIPNCRKFSLLFKVYQKAIITEHRYKALHRLETHLDRDWDDIFPRPSTDDKMADFCRALLNEVQYDSLLREKLARVIAVVAKCRRCASVQSWEALIDYIAQSPQSTTDHHMLVALAIVHEEPRIFGGHGEACHEFFEGCLKEKDSSLHRSILQAFIAVFASCKDVQDQLNQLHDAIVSMLFRSHVQRDEATGAPASNPLSNYFLELCLDTSDERTFILANEVISHQVFELGADCSHNLSKLLTKCVECPLAEVRSIALQCYSDATLVEGAALSPLRDLFPTILAMAESDVREESPATFRPLQALEGMSKGRRSCLLFEPYLLHIVALCREAVEHSHGSNTRIADFAYSTLHGVLRNYWDDMVIRFGDEYLKQLVAWTLEQSLSGSASSGYETLVGSMAHRVLAIPQITKLVEKCSNNSRLEKLSLGILCSVPALLEISEVVARIERALSDPVATTRAYLRSTALYAARAVAQCLESDERRVGKLAPIIQLIIKECTGEPVSWDSFEYTPIECIDYFSRPDMELLKPHLPALITRLCENHLTGYNRHEQSFRLISSLIDRYPEMIKTRASGQIPDIYECSMLEAAHACRDLAVTGARWSEVSYLQLCEEGAKKVDAVVEALGGPNTMTALVELSKKLSREVNYKKQYVAIMAIRAMGALCAPSTLLEDIVPVLISALISDQQSPQVRNLACATLRQLASIRAPILQEGAHDAIAPALVSLLTTSRIPRLAAVAGATLKMFISNCPPTCTVEFAPTLHKITAHLQSAYLTLLVEQKTLLLGQLMAPICELAKHFPLCIYSNYEDVAEPLRLILNERPPVEILVLIIKCASHCGEAAGRSRFKTDGVRVVATVSAHLTSLLTGYSEFTADVGRILAVIGEDAAAGFLPDLMPPILVALEQYKAAYGEADADRRHDLRRARDAAMRTIKCLEAAVGGAEKFEPYSEVVASLARIHPSDKKAALPIE